MSSPLYDDRIKALLAKGPFSADEEEEDAFSMASGHYTRGTGTFLIGLGETTLAEPGEGDATTTETAETFCRVEGPEAKTAAEAASVQCNALMVRSGQELKQAVHSFFPHLRSVRHSGGGRTNGYGDGNLAGASIGLARDGLTSGARRLQA